MNTCIVTAAAVVVVVVVILVFVLSKNMFVDYVVDV